MPLDDAVGSGRRPAGYTGAAARLIVKRVPRLNREGCINPERVSGLHVKQSGSSCVEWAGCLTTLFGTSARSPACRGVVHEYVLAA